MKTFKPLYSLLVILVVFFAVCAAAYAASPCENGQCQVPIEKLVQPDCDGNCATCPNVDCPDHPSNKGIAAHGAAHSYEKGRRRPVARAAVRAGRKIATPFRFIRGLFGRRR